MTHDISILVDYLEEYQAGDKESGYEIIKTSQIQNIIGRECSKWIPEYEPDELQHLCHIEILSALKRFKLPDLPKEAQAQHIISYMNKTIGLRLIDALEKIRKEECEISLESIVSTNQDGDSVTLGDSLQSPDHGPEEQFLIREKQETVRAAIKTLTPNQQEVVYMYYYKQMTQKEIADEFSISQQAVDKTLQRAQETLRLLLQGVK